MPIFTRILPLSIIGPLAARRFSTASTSKNLIYNPIRNEQEFNETLLLSTSACRALITLWTASWCSTCRAVAPIIQEFLSADATATLGDVPPVNYAEIEMDSPDMVEVNPRYMIRSVPMLLAFSRGEPQMETVVTDAKKIGNRQFLEEWVKNEAFRGGQGGAGGSLFGAMFGKS